VGGGLIYFNYFQKPVKIFKFKSPQECGRIKNDIFSIFEGVNDENPAIIHLNRKTGVVDKVVLPLDPYIENL
jgi:hypothetical protein